MTEVEVESMKTMYALYQWVFPLLLSIIAFVGGFAVKILYDMNKTLNYISVRVEVEIERHDSMEKNHEKLEERVLMLEQKKK
jgi:hypothetical protein